MRGVYTAAVLAELESRASARRNLSGLDVGKGFDLIVGTSTGAIVGCGLAVGVAPRAIAALYQAHGREVFPKKLPADLLGFLLQMFTRPRLIERGERALRSHLQDLLQKTTFKEVWERRHIALAIPAVNMRTYEGWIFKTPHDSQSNHRDDAVKLVDACLASSAAPLFRSLAMLEEPANGSYELFSDGGLWANNPVLVSLVESLRMATADEEIEIFCLGTCGRPEGEVIKPQARHRGLLGWKFGGVAAAVSIAAQQSAFHLISDFLCSHLNRSVRIVRFPAKAPSRELLDYMDLDETRNEGTAAMVGQARTDADFINSESYRKTEGGGAIDALFSAMPSRVQ